MHGARAVEVFADLQWRPQFARELRITRQIIVDDRLLEPIKPRIVERVTARQGIAEGKPLVEIDHQLDVVAGAFANRADGGKVIGEPVAPEPKLEALELA